MEFGSITKTEKMPNLSSLELLYDARRIRRRESVVLKAMRRRGLLSSMLLMTTTSVTAAPAPEPESRKTLLQKYLKKSEENKAKNDKERLDDYYKRNYKDYFEFIEGSLKAKKEELSESEKGILEWLQTNK